MKKLFATLFGVAVVFSAIVSCSKEETVPAAQANKGFNVNITVDGFGVSTKAAKSNWVTGDRIYLWYGQHLQQTPDIVIKYDGSSWNLDTDASVSEPDETSGRLSALYVAAGNLSDFSYSKTDDSNAKFIFPLYSQTINENSVIKSSLVVDCISSYTYDNGEFSATLSGWIFPNNMQVVVPGLTGNWAMKISKVAYVNPATGVVLNHGLDKSLWNIDLNTNAYAYGADNEDGKAFYFTVVSPVNVDQDYTFTLVNLDTFCEFEYNVKGKSALSNNFSVFHPIKIDASKFTPTFSEDLANNKFTYAGTEYPIVQLADGKKWMAAPMAFVPIDAIVSDAPAAGFAANKTVFYPYSSNGITCTPLKDAASIKAKGFLYSTTALFGTELTAENFGTFEGARGAVCPQGWHIPTRAEYFALVGYSNKSDYLGETVAQSDPSAPYYVSSHSGSTVGTLNGAGFNFILAGSVSNSSYSKLTISESACSVPGYYGSPSMTYIWSSSPAKSDAYFALMTTFNAASYPEGRVALANAVHAKLAAQVRCVRDTE